MGINLDALKNGGAAAFKQRSLQKDFKEKNSILNLEIDKLLTDKNQPRKEFDEEELKELAESIEKNGLIQPIAVRKEGEEYIIVSGERRFRASQLLKKKTIKAVLLTDIQPEQLGYLQMAENIKRSNLSVVEIAEFISSRLEKGEKQAEISDKLGIDKGQISKYAAWREMPECIQIAVIEKKIGGIQAAHALFKTWQEYPKETEKFIAERDKINQSEAKKFDPKSWFKPTPTDLVDNSDEQLNDEENSSEEPFSQEQTEESSIESESNLSEEKSAEPEEKSCLQATFSEQYSEDEGAPEENYVEKATDPYEESPATYKKPLILCLVDGRECELDYKKKAIDGYVIVKWEDGTEEEVAADAITINRIIEG